MLIIYGKKWKYLAKDRMLIISNDSRLDVNLLSEILPNICRKSDKIEIVITILVR